jgi:L-asparaginase II
VSESFVEVTRCDVVESRHRVHVAIAGADGRLTHSSGDPWIVTVARSAVKSIQAQPLIDDGVAERYGFGPREIALACASHSGEPQHVEVALSMLAAAGLTEEDLACGPHAPYYEPAALELTRRGLEPGRIHNNCSGKHAGMLALAVSHGWPSQGYHEGSHPVQQRMLLEMSRWTGLREADIALGVDGCGVVTYGVPLQSLAGAFARMAQGARDGMPGPAAVVAAMTGHPELVGGTGRLCTELMRATAGRIFVKVGAEGVYCGGIPERGVGLALKVEDGAVRASQPALLAVLGLLTGQEVILHDFAAPAVLNTRGEAVGRVRARINLEAASA